ncbi:MAG: hypothetical protein RIB60_09165 [Phycisphaerales bacterium]
MTRPLAISQLSPIGLDIGARSIKAAQLRRHGDSLRLEVAAEFRRAGEGAYPDADEIERIESVLYRRGFVGGRVVLGIPRSEAIFEEIERPPRGEGVPADQIVAAEVARVRRLEPGAIEHAWWEMPGTRQRASAHTAMATATLRDPLVETIDRFENVGLEVIRAEPVVTALSTVVFESRLAHDPFTVIVDGGWSGTSLGVLHKGVLVYQRSSEDCSLRSVATRAATTGRLDASVVVEMIRNAARGEVVSNAVVRRAFEELSGGIISEIEVSLGYASHRYREEATGAVYLCGGIGAVRLMHERAGQLPGCEALPLLPSMLASPDESGADAPSLAAACALAARFGG